MGLRILAGTISLALIGIGCGNNPVTAAASDAGYSNDASATGLVGGTTPLTPAELVELQALDCAGSLNDAGVSPLTDADAGACSYPMPSVQPGIAINPDKIAVVVALNSSQSILIGESTPDCSHGDGWYLSSDNGIVLCPQTCATARASSGSVVQIHVVCVYAGPV